MAYSDLRDFINALEKKKELKRISLEVDPYLEITEFADRSVKNNGPALLFEKPKGSRIPVLINSFASMRRILAKLLMSTGIRLPLGFSKSSAGPPFLTERSANSVISRTGSTSNEILFNSFFFSRTSMKSPRSLYAIQVLL